MTEPERIGLAPYISEDRPDVVTIDAIIEEIPGVPSTRSLELRVWYTPEQAVSLAKNLLSKAAKINPELGGLYIIEVDE